MVVVHHRVPMHDVPPELLALAVVKSCVCRDETATRQLLREVAGLEDKAAKRLIIRIAHIMSPKDRDWLRNTICPGLSNLETHEEAIQRVTQKHEEIVAAYQADKENR